MKKFLFLILFLLVSLIVFPAQADIPEKINIQGIINPRPADNTPIKITLYNLKTSGSQIGSSYTVNISPTNCDKNGFLNIQFPISVGMDFDIPYYMEFEVGGNKLEPRQDLLPVSYAVTAKNVYGGTVYCLGDPAIQGISKKDSETWGMLGYDALPIVKTPMVQTNEKHYYGAFGRSTSNNYGALGYRRRLNYQFVDEAGVYGRATATGSGIQNYGGYFQADGGKGRGVYAKSTGGNGYGVYGEGVTIGVYGEASGGFSAGVRGKGNYIGGWFESDNGYGVYSNAPNNYFTGNVGIGVLPPGYKLHVVGSTYSSTGWGGSDIRFKNNVTQLSNMLSKVNNLRGVSFEWNEKRELHGITPGRKDIGMIAQEVEPYFPELVSSDNNGYKAINYDKFTAVLIEAIKEQQKLIKSQQKEIDNLINRVAELEKK